MNTFEFLIQHFLAPFMLIFGLIGNILGVILVSRDRRQKKSFILMYKYLFATDITNLAILVPMYLENGFSLSLEDLNKYACRLWNYIYYLFGSIPSMLLVYISLEQVVSIKRPIYNSFFRRKRFQRIYLTAVIAFNSVYYLPTLFLVEFKQHSWDNINLNHTNSTKCLFNSLRIMTSFDFANNLIPFIFIFIFTGFLIVSIHRMRSQMLQTFRRQTNKILRKNIRLIVALVSMNVYYLISILQFYILNFNRDDNREFISYLTSYLYGTSFFCNFYFLFAINKYFQKEFLRMIHLKR
jgi:hypothetical protein